MYTEVVFVLVGTSHSGNIGAAARAMKTMNFGTLRLVACCDHRVETARVRASGADDVLDGASCFANLDDAVADCHWVVGTSARERQIAVAVEDCRALARRFAAQAWALAQASTSSDPCLMRVALVFGPERSGLSNREIERCTHLTRIPCNAMFSSLNLGSAVQVLAYEWARAFGKLDVAPDVDAEACGNGGKQVEQPVASRPMQHFFQHLERVMVRSEFLDPAKPRFLMRRLRRYFERNRPSENELNILRGILTATERYLPEGVDGSSSGNAQAKPGSNKRDSIPVREANRLP